MAKHLLLKQLDAADNEEKVREDIALGHYNPNDAALAQEWLRRKEEARSSAAASRAEERALKAEARAIAAERIARRDSRIAVIAVIVAVITLAHDLL